MYVVGALFVVSTLFGGGCMTRDGATRRRERSELPVVVVQRLQNVSQRLNLTCPWGGEYDY